MIRASGNSPRIALIASMPPISGICKSISVTSGWCLRNSSTASRPLEASRDQFHIRLTRDQRGDAFAQQG